MSERPSERETQLVELLRSIDEPAPERLHRRVGEMVDAATPARRGLRSPLRLRLGLAGGALTAGVAALVLALSLGGSSTPTPTLAQETALTLRPATLTAPGEDTSRRTQLDASVEGVSFPYWEEKFGWRTSGARRDSLAGRTVNTVFYTGAGGARIGYAIVSGPGTSSGESGGVLRWRDGTRYRLTQVHGVPVVTWLRDGRRCVVSGTGVSAQELLRLASWDDRALA